MKTHILTLWRNYALKSNAQRNKKSTRNLDVQHLYKLICIAAAGMCISTAGYGVTHYVSIDGGGYPRGSHTYPFTSWATAATNIQAATDAASDGSLVLLDNDVFVQGTITITNSITVRGRTGHARDVVVQGLGYSYHYNERKRRVFHLTNCIAKLESLTVSNGFYNGDYGYLEVTAGAGVRCESTAHIISNCVITSNYRPDNCAGVYGGTIYDSLITRNDGDDGAGVRDSKVYNSIISYNSASDGGGGAMDSVLSNCVIIGNVAQPWGGGGFWDCTAYDCLIISNQCIYNGSGGGANKGKYYNCVFTLNRANLDDGGALYDATAYNCVLSNNFSLRDGGGAAGFSDLYNCLVVDNVSSNSGGTDLCVLRNCTVADNTALNPAGCDGAKQCYSYNSIIWGNGNDIELIDLGTNINMCSSALIHGVNGNITNDPHFVDNGDYRLAFNSPCINNGNNLYTNDNATTALALGGVPRILDGTVDMGCYEQVYDPSLSVSAPVITSPTLVPLGMVKTNIAYSTVL